MLHECAVVERDSGLKNFSFGHEVGHLLGCGHGTDETGVFDDSAGWHFSIGSRDYHTIMAYRAHDAGRAYNAFSSPRAGSSTTGGGSFGKEGVADHARTIQQTMGIVAKLK